MANKTFDELTARGTVVASDIIVVAETGTDVEAKKATVGDIAGAITGDDIATAADDATTLHAAVDAATTFALSANSAATAAQTDADSAIVIGNNALAAAQAAVQDINGGTDISVSESSGTFTINYTGSGGPGGGIEEAPNDGETYGRQSEGWVALGDTVDPGTVKSLSEPTQSGGTVGTEIDNIISLTRAEYDDLTVVDNQTVYIITDESDDTLVDSPQITMTNGSSEPTVTAGSVAGMVSLTQAQYDDRVAPANDASIFYVISDARTEMEALADFFRANPSAVFADFVTHVTTTYPAAP